MTKDIQEYVEERRRELPPEEGNWFVDYEDHKIYIYYKKQWVEAINTAYHRMWEEMKGERDNS